jgi:hypothetical protein
VSGLAIPMELVHGRGAWRRFSQDGPVSAVAVGVELVYGEVFWIGEVRDIAPPGGLWGIVLAVFLFTAVMGIERCTNNFVEARVAIDAHNFILHVGNVLLKELADVGEYRGVARRNTILGDRFEKIAEGVIEIGVGAELVTECGEFLADLIRVDELLFLTSVEKAISAVPAPTRHGTGTLVGKCKLAGGGEFRFLGRWLFLGCCDFFSHILLAIWNWIFGRRQGGGDARGNRIPAVFLGHDLVANWNGIFGWRRGSSDGRGKGIPANFK